jgi:hypothetical protein
VIAHIGHMMRDHGEAKRDDKEGDDPGTGELTDHPTVSSIGSIAAHEISTDASAARRNPTIVSRFVRGAGGLLHSSVIGASAVGSHHRLLFLFRAMKYRMKPNRRRIEVIVTGQQDARWAAP